MIQNRDLVSFLKSKTVNSGFIDQIKVSYRPLICPFDQLLDLVGDARSVFDIGCGSGQFALLLAEFTSVSKIGGIEIDAKLVNNARELLMPYQQKIQIDFQIYDGITLPGSIHDHDIVFLVDVIHHIPVARQATFLKEVFSKMRSGSVLIVKDIDAGSPFVIFNKLHDLVFSHEFGHEWSFNKFCKTAQEIGFKISKATKKQIYVYPHYTFVLSK